MAEAIYLHSETTYKALKTKLHAQVLEEMDLETVNRLSETVARERVGGALRDMLNRERTPLASADREKIAVEVLDELFGLGTLETLLADPTISDILVNGPGKTYVERHGLMEGARVRFDADPHLLGIIERLVPRAGRR